MKAIIVKETGNVSQLKIKEIQVPQIATDEALVRLKAIGINYIDIYMRSGRYATTLPFIPGFEGAGIVEEVGRNVTNVKIGDRVAYLGNIGSYAEFNNVKSEQLIPLPEHFSFEQGAAFPLQGLTAHYLLHEYYQIKPHDVVLVHAAAGGVGLLLVQWLKKLKATVIATVSTAEKADIAKRAGADHTIIYTQNDFVSAVREITSDQGADYILDGVGKATFNKSLEAAKITGHVCLYGSASGPADPILPNSLQTKGLTISGGSIFNYLTSNAAIVARAKEVIAGIKAGWLNINIHQILPIEQAAQAHEMLENRNTMGKIILSTRV